MPQFIIHGGRPLSGKVRIAGSKNAVLPILAATLLTTESCFINGVPDIDDVHTMLGILESLGSKVDFRNHTVQIQTKRLRPNRIAGELVCKMRASVLLLGPLLARTGYVRSKYPGGCILGARPINIHEDVFRQLGIQRLKSDNNEVIFRGYPHATEVILPEFSVTATENAIMACALTKAKTTIRLAALEPHIQDLCQFLSKMGMRMEGIGTHSIILQGTKKLRGVHYRITPDYLEAGTLILAAILTNGRVTIEHVPIDQLYAFWNLLREMNIPFVLGKNSVKIIASHGWRACKRLQTNVFPGFPTDLQPPFAILLTQANGVSRIHETLFEGRFNYFPELKKMGASIKKLNPHEALITGPTMLHGRDVKSCDIRAGAAMILAALVAKGKTVVKDIHYIDRGYERFDEKLRLLGADVVRID